MKNLINVLSLVLFIGIIPMSAQKNDQAKSTETLKPKVYYFHASRRCATCQAVESVTKEVVGEFYSDKVTLGIFNREKDKNEALVEKYQISGQTLLIVKGDKVINLTNEAFLNARNHPDKFKIKLKSTIDSLL